jgi:signal transduction histidine kinase
MAEHIRLRDWSTSPLGPIASWSETLLASVNMMLGAAIPMQLFWGPELVCLYNDAMRPSLSEKHPMALGSAGADVWREAWSIVGPQLASVLRNRAPLNFKQELVPIWQDGQLRQTYWDYSYSPLFDPAGNVVGILDVAHDSTGTVLAQQQRQIALDRLEQILQATADGVALLDRDWNFAYLNDAGRRALLDVSDDLIGKNAWTTFPSMIYEGSPFVYHYYRAMDQGIPGEFETRYPEPLDMTLHLFVRPVLEGILIVFRDVTDQKRTHAALMQTEKLAAVGRLAASIAHEINNPLESVTNLLYLVRLTNDPDEAREYLELAERELRRVSAISNQTLRFYRQSTNARPVTCEDLFESVLSIHQGRLVNSNVTVEKRKQATELVECFDGEIRQVLNNLVGNAVDAMHPGGGRLLVRSRNARHPITGEAGLALTVADTGSGIPEPIQKKVFGAFYTTKGIGGTGLGLWVSKEIVDRHRGTLHFRSSQSVGGNGTVFLLWLPLKAADRQGLP